MVRDLARFHTWPFLEHRTLEGRRKHWMDAYNEERISQGRVQREDGQGFANSISRAARV
jgi:hypothetical protein